MIYLGADHRGFKLKEALKPYLKALGYEFEDLGALELKPDDDFPVAAFAVADKVAAAPNEHLGILICGSGIGEAIAANKVRGIRAGNCWSARVAEFARRDDACNVLALPADYLSEAEAQEIVKIWLKTPPAKEPRYQRRINEISARERA